MVRELVTTYPWRLFVTLDGHEFDILLGGGNPTRILVGVCFRDTLTVIDGWMDGCRSEGVPF